MTHQDKHGSASMTSEQEVPVLTAEMAHYLAMNVPAKHEIALALRAIASGAAKVVAEPRTPVPELPPGEREAEATAWVFPRRYGSGVTLSKSEWDFIRKQAGGMEDYEPTHYYPLFRVPPQVDALISNLRTKCIAQPTFATDPYWHGYLNALAHLQGGLSAPAAPSKVREQSTGDLLLARSSLYMAMDAIEKRNSGTARMQVEYALKQLDAALKEPSNGR